MSAHELASGLTQPQRRALRRRQPSLFGDQPIVAGHGMTMRALRVRGIVKGAMPFARLTDLGASVCRIARVDEQEIADA